MFKRRADEYGSEKTQTLSKEYAVPQMIGLLFNSTDMIVVLGNIFLHPLADLLGSTTAIHEGATTYLCCIASFSPFFLFSFFTEWPDPK